MEIQRNSIQTALHMAVLLPGIIVGLGYHKLLTVSNRVQIYGRQWRG